MQTFLPFADFARSAAVLDDRRLGKQRVETLQILRALHCEGYGWAAHPAVMMWRGHTAALVSYGVEIVTEWERRGYADATRASIAEFSHPHGLRSQQILALAGRLPPWLGCEAIHRSHRAALLRKDPEHYRHVLPEDPDPPTDYVWPEPPAPPAVPGEPTAWVVRGRRLDEAVSVAGLSGEGGWARSEARPRRRTKRVRQVERLVDGMAPGDPLVVPEGDDLHLGVVDGLYCWDGGAHVRPVRWLAVLSRAALRFPAALQDPQVVFVLHDEPAVTAAAQAAKPGAGSFRRGRPH